MFANDRNRGRPYITVELTYRSGVDHNIRGYDLLLFCEILSCNEGPIVCSWIYREGGTVVEHIVRVI